MSESAKQDTKQEQAEKRFELWTGITLAFFAAALAITDLGAGKYGDDEIIGTNAQTSALSWYQSKSIKQSLVEGQRDLLQSLLAAGTVQEEHAPALQNHVHVLDAEIARYKKEKNEIMLGSVAVGKENWVQDIDGELGKVIGAKEWEHKLAVLGSAGDVFDIAVLFLQLGLVLGAMALVVQATGMKKIFFGAMVFVSLIGSFFAVRAFLLAATAG